MDNSSTSPTKICPTCGSRANEDAPRCLVCGTTFIDPKTASKPKKEQTLRGSRMPIVTLSVPIMLVLFLIFVIVGGGLTYLALNVTGGIAEPNAGPTAPSSPTPKKPGWHLP